MDDPWYDIMYEFSDAWCVFAVTEGRVRKCAVMRVASRRALRVVTLKSQPNIEIIPLAMARVRALRHTQATKWWVARGRAALSTSGATKASAPRRVMARASRTCARGSMDTRLRRALRERVALGCCSKCTATRRTSTGSLVCTTFPIPRVFLSNFFSLSYI